MKQEKTADLQKKRENEKFVVGQMIRLYCKKNHKYQKGLCPDCENLCNYAVHRIDVCPFMENKTFCSNCKVHCYQKEYRDKIRRVMRFSGPRMLFVHPVMAIKHLVLQIKEKKKSDARTKEKGSKASDEKPVASRKDQT